MNIIVIVLTSFFLAILTHFLNPNFFDNIWNGYKKLIRDDNQEDDEIWDRWS